MATLQFCTFLMFVFAGITQGNHAMRGRTAGIGRVANPFISIDPFAVPSSGRLSASSSKSSSSSSSSASSGGSGRSLSASASIGIQPRLLSSRIRSNARRRGMPFMTRIQGRPMIIVRPGSQGQRPRFRGGITQGHHLSRNHGLIDRLVLSPRSHGRQISIGHQPPGVSFLGGQRLSGLSGNVGLAGNVRHYIPAQTVQVMTSPLLQGQLPITLTGISSLIGGSVLPGPAAAQLPAGSAKTSNTVPGSNGLQVGGLTPKGELIIKGPGGTITIGRDLLSGISTTNTFPLLTEFEEVELEGPPRGAVPGQTINTLKLTEPGRGSIVINKSRGKGATGSSGSVAPSGAGMIEVINSGAKTGNTVASSSASASSSSASASSSSSASSSASSAASAATSTGAVQPAIAVGNGITVESGGKAGRVIRIGDAAGKTQLITLGGQKDQIQFANGGSGLSVPGNATFVVGG